MWSLNSLGLKWYKKFVINEYEFCLELWFLIILLINLVYIYYIVLMLWYI